MIPPTSSRKEIKGYKASVHRQITRIKRIDNETLFIEDEKKNSSKKSAIGDRAKHG